VALQLGDGAASLGAACAACLVGAWLLVAVFLREPDDEIEPAVTPAMVPTVIPIRTDDVA
jgi:hypothetical protein